MTRITQGLGSPARNGSFFQEEGGEASAAFSQFLLSLFPSFSRSNHAVGSSRIDSEIYSELALIFQERESDLFYDSLLAFGARQEHDGNLELAGRVYAAVAAGAGRNETTGAGLHARPRSKENDARDKLERSLLQRAREKLAALLGQGSIGPRAEFLLRRLAQESCEPTSLFAMGAAGALFKVTRLGVLSRLVASPTANVFTRGLGARTLASLTAFSMEAPAFTLTRHVAQGAIEKPPEGGHLGKDIVSSYLVLGGMRLAGLAAKTVSVNLIRNAGARSAGTQLLRTGILQTGILGGILLGHRLEAGFGLRERRDGATTLIDSLALLLQFNVAGKLCRHAFGERFHAWEQGLELRFSRLGPNPDKTAPPLPASPQTPAVAMSYSQRSPTRPNAHLPTSEQSAELRARFLGHFRNANLGGYAEEIIHAALATPSPQSHFHERLLEAYALFAPQATRSDLYTAKVIQNIFQYDALHSSTGSFENALLQLLLSRLLSDPSSKDRNLAMGTVFQAMEAGLSRPALEGLLARHELDRGWELPADPRFFPDFYWRHEREAKAAWRRYRWADRPLLLNFVSRQAQEDPALASRMIHLLGAARDSGRYSHADIDAVLDYARGHRLGWLVLQRLFLIFASGDAPAKLRELVPEKARVDTLSLVLSLAEQGLKKESIAQQLNNTRHTAYLDDMRVAKKLVSVLLEIHPVLMNPELRRKPLERFQQTVLTLAQDRRGLGPRELMEVLEQTPTQTTRPLLAAWRQRFFHLALMSEPGFDRYFHRRWPGGFSGEQGLYEVSTRPERPDAIILRGLPSADRNAPDYRDRLFDSVVWSLMGLFHEFEHSRHFRGRFDGIERGATPYRIGQLSVEERLATEILSCLEEQRWYITHWESDFWEGARRLGDNLAGYYRNYADYAYFGDKNRKVAEQWRLRQPGTASAD